MREFMIRSAIKAIQTIAGGEKNKVKLGSLLVLF
jgi:hypothetical protein